MQSAHTTCSGLTRAEINLLNVNEKRGLAFHCDFCVNERKTITELRDLVASLKTEIEELKRKTSDNAEKHSSDLIDTVVSEVNERNLRAKNIIISNLPESNKNTTDEIIADDLSRVTNLICTEGVVGQPDVIKCFRIGKAQNSTVRPIKVVT